MSIDKNRDRRFDDPRRFKKDKSIYIRMSEEDLDNLERASELLDTSKSDVVRRAVEGILRGVVDACGGER